MKKYPIEVEETRQINRITFRQTMTDALNAFNIERGLIYTMKLLFVNPRKIIDEYLYEGRYTIVNAFRLLVLTSAVSLFVIWVFGLDTMMLDFQEGYNMAGTDADAEEAAKEAAKVAGIMTQLFLDWYNLFLWISIPVYGFFTYLFFMKSDYNYAEHLVIQSFYICALNLITIAIFPLYFLTDQVAMINLMLLISVAYFFYFTIKVFKVKGTLPVIKTVLLYLINNIVYAVILLLVLGMFVGYELEKMNQ